MQASNGTPLLVTDREAIHDLPMNPMNPVLRRYRPESEYFFEEGCYISELSNAADDPSVSIARARVPAGVTTRLHRLHGIVERYVMLEGQGEVTLGDAVPQQVNPGDVVLIPALCPQRIHNPGPEDLVFLAICTPRFVVEAYEDIDD